MDVDAETRALLERGYDAFNRADVEDFVAVGTEDVEVFPVRGLLEGTRYHGHDGVRQFFEDLREEWDSLEMVPEEVVPVGDLVVVAARLTARARSGVEIAQRFGQVFELDRERALVRSLVTYATPDDALRAAREAASSS